MIADTLPAAHPFFADFDQSERQKQQRERHFHLIEIPTLRLVGFSILIILVLLRHAFVQDADDSHPYRLGAVVLGYGAASWAGREALDILERERFDVAIMDVQMPDVDGFQATALIRANVQKTGTHLPIIAMTAHAMSGDRERCLRAGMDGYVSKPIDTATLMEELRRVVPAES